MPKTKSAKKIITSTSFVHWSYIPKHRAVPLTPLESSCLPLEVRSSVDSHHTAIQTYKAKQTSVPVGDFMNNRESSLATNKKLQKWFMFMQENRMKVDMLRWLRELVASVGGLVRKKDCFPMTCTFSFNLEISSFSSVIIDWYWETWYCTSRTFLRTCKRSLVCEDWPFYILYPTRLLFQPPPPLVWRTET